MDISDFIKDREEMKKNIVSVIEAFIEKYKVLGHPEGIITLKENEGYVKEKGKKRKEVFLLEPEIKIAFSYINKDQLALLEKKRNDLFISKINEITAERDHYKKIVETLE